MHVTSSQVMALAAQVTPVYTGYGTLNPNIPTPIAVRCGEGPHAVNGTSSASASAQQYLNDLKTNVGDGFLTINGTQPKGSYNQSFAPGLFWQGKCVRSRPSGTMQNRASYQVAGEGLTGAWTRSIYWSSAIQGLLRWTCKQLRAASLPCHRCILDNGHPSCNFTFDAASRALGLSQTRRVPPGGTVSFTSCGVYMDQGVVTSPTCFEVSAAAGNGGGGLTA